MARTLQYAGAMRWLVALSLLTAAGCYGEESDILLFEESFEDPAAVAASWTSNAPIDLQPTIHPAEHALFVIDGQILGHPLGLTVWDDFSDGVWLEYSSNCEHSAEMWLEQQPDLSFRIIASTEATAAPVLEFERWYTSIPPGPEPFMLSGIELRFTGGTCAIDNLRLYQPANITGY